MLFNSFSYLVFLPLVVILYYSLKHKNRWILLLISSYFFYGIWNHYYLIILVLNTVFDYTIAIKIASATSLKHRKIYLLSSYVANLSLLIVFKYSGFFAANLNSIGELIGFGKFLPLIHLLLPVGISFYTFQSIAYVTNVYRNKLKPEKHLGRFAVFISFFPQLISGPIERGENFLPQLKIDNKFNSTKAYEAIFQILIGFFKKLVIANRCAIIVNTVYNNPYAYQGLPLILATILFAFQIYCDFSGYTDIAIGSAKLLNVNLSKNFNFPYFASSVQDFWARWHISLSTWFRDYLYIPLGGNRVNFSKWCINILLVFTISGFWHGAKWTFVIWGMFHGIVMILERIFGDKLIKNNLLKMLTTFIVINISWVFFRANSLSEALYIISNFLVNLNLDYKNINLGVSKQDFILTIVISSLFIIFENKIVFSKKFVSIISLIIGLAIIFFGKSGEQFIYFQF